VLQTDAVVSETLQYGVREDGVGKYENRESVRVDRRDGVMGSRV
jgi:hypothetical protein